MSIGAPITKKFKIGTFEVRIGPLSKAGLLTPEHSIGVVDSVALNVEQQSTEVMAGFPQMPADVAITSYVTGLTGTMREYSRRNLNVLLGNGVFAPDAAADVKGGTLVTTSAIAKGATTLTASEATTLAKDDVIVVYSTTRPERVSICRVASDVTASATIGLNSTTPIVADTADTNAFEKAEVVKWYKSPIIAVGNISSISYFSVQLLSTDRGTSATTGFNFWKGTLAAGMKMNMTPAEFASSDLEFKFLIPGRSEYASGGDLEHMSGLIASNPVGLMFDVSDAATS
jgi:hypothetical protein